VGFLALETIIWFFASHIKINKKYDLEFRKKLSMGTLKALDIIL